MKEQIVEKDGKFVVNGVKWPSRLLAEQWVWYAKDAPVSGKFDIAEPDGKWTETSIGSWDIVKVKAFNGDVVKVEIKSPVGFRTGRCIIANVVEDSGAWKKGDHFLGYVKDIVEIVKRLE